jgi:hypothetical protein
VAPAWSTQSSVQEAQEPTVISLPELSTRKWMLALAFVWSAQLAFTAAIRIGVEPHLRPAMHWKYGLDRNSDSQFFYESALQLSDCLRQDTWTNCTQRDPGDGTFIRPLAWLFHVSGISNPWLVFVLNAFVSCLSLLLLSLLLRTIGFETTPSRVVAALFGVTPLWLFLHSELLREPYFIAAMFSLVLGFAALLGRRRGTAAARPGPVDLLWIALVLSAYALVVAFRPYMLVPVFVALSAMALLGAAWRMAGSLASPVSVGRLACAVAALTIAWTVVVRPQLGRIHTYGDIARTDAATLELVNERRERAREARLAAANGLDWTRADAVMLTAPCTVPWTHTSGVPASIDSKLEALSCQRQEFQRSCDAAVLGIGADQNCDLAQLKSAAAVFRHLPSALAFSILTPFPDMWFAGFGSGGTGLRRIGYVVDGVISYVALLGLVCICAVPARTRSLAIAVCSGLLMLLVIYGMSVPTQFVLARMRESLYVPFLAVGLCTALDILRRRRATAVDGRKLTAAACAE